VTLAREHSAKLTVVHVVDEDLPASLADAQEKAAKQAIHKHIGGLTADNGPHISIEVVFGRAYVDILEMSEKTEAEMIVLGMHREDAFKDMFRGTTVERIIRAGNVPVLLVKDRVSGPYQRVMVGVDFSVYSRRAVEFAVQFVPGGEFQLVHAYDVPFKGFLYGHHTRREVSKQHQVEFQQMVEEEMATFLAGVEAKAPKLERVMQEGTPHEVIHRQIDRLKPDLLVLGTHGRTGVAHAFLGSVAEDLLRNPPCDVLAVKAW
jgi:nucleotide-binding universal stress UspA family protein